MAGSTTPDTIYYRTGGDSVSLEDESAAQATSIQNAFNTRAIKSYKWANTAARTAQVGMSLGDEGVQTDTSTRYYYDGTQWKNASSGLQVVKPSSASGTGVTMTSNGTILFSGATTASGIALDGLFTSEFDFNLFVFDVQSVTGALQIDCRMRLTGSTDSATNYSLQALDSVTTTTTSAQSSAATTWPITTTTGATGQMLARIEMMGAGTTRRTTFISTSSMINSTTSMAISTRGGYHAITTAYDGIIFYPSANTMTGALRCYAYNNMT